MAAVLFEQRLTLRKAIKVWGFVQDLTNTWTLISGWIEEIKKN